MNKKLYRAAVNDIKVNEEVIKELAIKMKETQIVQKNRNKFGVIAATLTILIISAVFMQQRFTQTNEIKISKLTAGSTIALSKKKGSIYVNKIEGQASSKLFIPDGSISKDYSLRQLPEVFGRDPLPSIPDGFKAAMSGTNITYDPQGKMLFMSALIYSKDIENSEAPSFDIKLNKNALPPKDCVYAENRKESVIGDTKVLIGTMSQGDKFDAEGKPTIYYDVYSAEFIYKGVGYSITTKRTDGETFLNILYSIIK